jgi:hypothetical protein
MTAPGLSLLLRVMMQPHGTMASAAMTIIHRPMVIKSMLALHHFRRSWCPRIRLLAPAQKCGADHRFSERGPAGGMSAVINWQEIGISR